MFAIKNNRPSRNNNQGIVYNMIARGTDPALIWPYYALEQPICNMKKIEFEEGYQHTVSVFETKEEVVLSESSCIIQVTPDSKLNYKIMSTTEEASRSCVDDKIIKNAAATDLKNMIYIYDLIMYVFAYGYEEIKTNPTCSRKYKYLIKDGIVLHTKKDDSNERIVDLSSEVEVKKWKNMIYHVNGAESESHSSSSIVENRNSIDSFVQNKKQRQITTLLF